MYKIGVFAGKFLPAHLGHLNTIIQASTLTKKLYVVISDNSKKTFKICGKHKLRQMPLLLRCKWLSQELSGFDNIEVVPMIEDEIKSYPYGIKEWSEKLLKIIPQPIDVVFGNEKEYKETYMRFIPNAKYKTIDVDRKNINISATQIRSNCMGNFNFLINSAKKHFTKRVLITGTESTGKTTLVKCLSKMFNTCYSEEYGRYYARDYLGGNENLFTGEDFIKIIQIQQMQDEGCLNKANKIVFFDTDAVITQYYAKVYLGKELLKIEEFVDSDKYDVVFLMSPNVKWVADGQRFISDQKEREKMHELLKKMYESRGYKNKIIEINESTYNKRLLKIIEYLKSSASHET